MSEKNPIDQSHGTAPVERSDPAEAKRLAARRRFLQKSAAGSGVAVLTLYHTRGYAQSGKKLLLSSAQACMSITGTPGKTVKKQDSVVPYIFDAKGKKKKNIVQKQECVLK